MVILYSNNCPKCRILKQQLDEAEIEYTLSIDFTKLTDRGFSSVPVLEMADGTMLGFDQAMQIVTKRG